MRSSSKCNMFFKRFRRKDDGAATVEAVIWLPLFIFLLALAVDVSMTFHAHSRVLRVVQDVNRAYSVGRIETVEEAEAMVAALLPDIAANIVVDKSVTDGIIGTRVQVPVADIVVLGAVPDWADLAINVESYHYAEL